jgi:uncharacterized protein (DUF433 family)
MLLEWAMEGGSLMNLPEFLTRDADGEIRLTGHRIGLYTVARLRQEGRSAQQIAEELPSIPRTLLDQVLAFCAVNQSEVNAYVVNYEADLKRLASAAPGPGLGKMREQSKRLRQAEARHASDPSWSALPVAEKLRRLEIELSREPW